MKQEVWIYDCNIRHHTDYITPITPCFRAALKAGRIELADPLLSWVRHLRPFTLLYWAAALSPTEACPQSTLFFVPAFM